MELENFIDEILSLAKVSEEAHFQRRAGGSKRGDELEIARQRKLRELAPLITMAAMIEVVQHYEKKVVKLEAESMRMAIMRETIREVIKEEQAK